METKEIRNLVKFCNEHGITTRDVFNEIVNNSTDFEVDDWRFIHSDEIDEIQCNELESDLYILGCFNDYFLSDILDIDVDVIESMQRAEAFEAIGKLIISMDKLEELQEAYVSADGYGHHFAHYDFNEYEIYINDTLYYAFRIN